MKISEERIKWVLRDYEGVLKYCDARYENYHRSYICEKQELQNFVLPKIDFKPRSSSGGDKRDLSDLYESWTERQKKFQKELISLMLEVEKERRTKLIFLTLSACIISTLILGIAQMVLSVFHFSRQARSDLEFYLENTSGQFDTRIKNM